MEEGKYKKGGINPKPATQKPEFNPPAQKISKRAVKMVTRKTWEEFRESGLLWFINMILHTFGWSIVVEVDTETQEVKKAYPARVKFRGFAEKDNTEGYQKVSKYLKEKIEQLEKESLK